MLLRVGDRRNTAWLRFLIRRSVTVCATSVPNHTPYQIAHARVWGAPSPPTTGLDPSNSVFSLRSPSRHKQFVDMDEAQIDSEDNGSESRVWELELKHQAELWRFQIPSTEPHSAEGWVDAVLAAR